MTIIKAAFVDSKGAFVLPIDLASRKLVDGKSDLFIVVSASDAVPAIVPLTASAALQDLKVTLEAAPQLPPELDRSFFVDGSSWVIASILMGSVGQHRNLQRQRGWRLVKA